jgi:hypothetical protein
MDSAEAHRKVGEFIYRTTSGVAVLGLVVGLVRAWANGSMAGSTEDLLGNLVGIAGYRGLFAICVRLRVVVSVSVGPTGESLMVSPERGQPLPASGPPLI